METLPIIQWCGLCYHWSSPFIVQMLTVWEFWWHHYHSQCDHCSSCLSPSTFLSYATLSLFSTDWGEVAAVTGVTGAAVISLGSHPLTPRLRISSHIAILLAEILLCRVLKGKENNVVKFSCKNVWTLIYSPNIVHAWRGFLSLSCGSLSHRVTIVTYSSCVGHGHSPQ